MHFVNICKFKNNLIIKQLQQCFIKKKTVAAFIFKEMETYYQNRK